MWQVPNTYIKSGVLVLITLNVTLPMLCASIPNLNTPPNVLDTSLANSTMSLEQSLRRIVVEGKANTLVCHQNLQIEANSKVFISWTLCPHP